MKRTEPQARIATANYIAEILELRGISAKRLLTLGGSRQVTKTRKDLACGLSARGLTQSEIARAIGVGKDVINNYLKERKKV